jgi:predicted DNA-binding transcriptional regulator AlpA
MTARKRKDRPLQLSLSLRFSTPRGDVRARTELRRDGGSLDCRMNSAEVQRVTGVHRTTLYRWTRTGEFPVKHHAGGWLRSEIEFWLSQRAPSLQAQWPLEAARSQVRHAPGEPRGMDFEISQENEINRSLSPIDFAPPGPGDDYA